MTDTPIADAADAAVHGSLPQRPRPAATPLRLLAANPLIAAIDACPGMGQRLTPADVDTVLRVVASIEAARTGPQPAFLPAPVNGDGSGGA